MAGLLPAQTPQNIGLSYMNNLTVAGTDIRD